MCKFYFKSLLCIFIVLCAISLTACSDGDEPKEDNYKFAPLEEILGSTTWETESHSFVGQDGSTYTLDDIQIGGAPSPNLALENGSLIYYIVTGPVKKYIYDYRFDRTTGDIYVGQDKEPEMRIVSVEKDKILVQSYFGILDRYYEKHGLPGATDGKTSYMLSELVPADEALMERIAEPDDIIDRRK